MFDLGWTELLLIGIVALIVVGPKDLPGLFRALGRFTGRAKQMAREFSNAMNAAADEAGVKDIDKTIRAAANPTRGVADSLKEHAKVSTGLKSGGETEKLAKKRAEQVEKIRENSKKVAEERLAREAKEAEAAAAAEAADPENPVKDDA